MASADRTLADALSTLATGLNDGTELSSRFAQFASVVRAAVPSYCGLWMTLITDGIPVTISAPVDSGDVVTTGGAASSLVIALSSISPRTSGELVLFASAAGAFVDLAADLAYATSTELSSFEVDTRLGAQSAAPIDVGAFSVIHQAVGYLIAAGTVPELAHARIAELAVRGGYDLAAAAQRVVTGHELNGPGLNED